MSVKAVIVGANGYSGEELVRLLAGHPGASIVAVTSRQHAGRSVADALPRLRGHASVEGLVFRDLDAPALLETGAEIFFLALPHGLAAEFAQPLLKVGERAWWT
ncbi:MAG: hypothetical protein N2322_06300 [Terrimicrobiaceae bacterium]|nr:hypothetical protein [Terrimicrobiaceae bacterium]